MKKKAREAKKKERIDIQGRKENKDNSQWMIIESTENYYMLQPQSYYITQLILGILKFTKNQNMML